MSSATPHPASHSPNLQPFARRSTMSITQTYYLAHKARAKLSHEAAQADHDLRLLVGHANLLDSLMLELADAEREQERWFNQSVRGASTGPARHIRWADRVEEQPADNYYESASDSDSDLDEDDFDEDDFEMASVDSVRDTMRVPLRLDHEGLKDDLEEDYAQLELVRTTSHSSSPPELMDPDSDTSDDDMMPPSPADASLPYSAAQAKDESAQQDSLYDDDVDDYYVARRNSAGLVSAISVY